LAGESTEVGRGIQNAAKEISTALKPDLGLLQESKQAVGVTGDLTEKASSPGTVDPVRSAKETDGGSGRDEEEDKEY
jgi:hypothetical protein